MKGINDGSTNGYSSCPSKEILELHLEATSFNLRTAQNKRSFGAIFVVNQDV